MVVRHGKTEYVPSVQLTIISIKKVFAVKLNPNVKHSTLKLVFAKHVTKDIKLKTEFAFFLMFLVLKIKDANLGKMEHVFNAQQDGILVQTKFAIQLMTFAELGMKQQELVNHAIKDMLQKVEAALETRLIYNHQQIHYALFGKMVNVRNVLKEHISIMEFAHQYLITAKHGMLWMVNA